MPILSFPLDYYLPKDEIEFYQFCYVDGVGQVRGASTPFCFRKTAEQNTEGCLDDNLLVVTTQVSDGTDMSGTNICLVGQQVLLHLEGFYLVHDLLAAGATGTEHPREGRNAERAESSNGGK